LASTEKTAELDDEIGNDEGDDEDDDEEGRSTSCMRQLVHHEFEQNRKVLNATAGRTFFTNNLNGLQRKANLDIRTLPQLP